MKITLRARVRQYVRKHGPCTVAQVTGALGRYVSAVQAARSAQRDFKRRGTKKPKVDLVVHGTKQMIGDVLSQLMREGEFKRVAPATYKAA